MVLCVRRLPQLYAALHWQNKRSRLNAHGSCGITHYRRRKHTPKCSNGQSYQRKTSRLQTMHGWRSSSRVVRCHDKHRQVYWRRWGQLHSGVRLAHISCLPAIILCYDKSKAPALKIAQKCTNFVFQRDKPCLVVPAIDCLLHPLSNLRHVLLAQPTCR